MSGPGARWASFRGVQEDVGLSPPGADVGLGLDVDERKFSGGEAAAKQYKLFVLASGLSRSVGAGWICGGVLGGADGLQPRFCLKEVKGVGVGCGTRHRASTGSEFKFERENLYVRSGAQAAFCIPTVPVRLIDDELLSKWMAEKNTASDWCSLFATVQAATNVSSTQDVARRLDLLSGSVGAKTPGRVKATKEESPSTFEMVSLAKTTPDKREDWESSDTYPRGLARAFFRAEDALETVTGRVENQGRRLTSLEEGLIEDIESLSVRLARVENVTGMGSDTAKGGVTTEVDLENFKEDVKFLVDRYKRESDESHQDKLDVLSGECAMEIQRMASRFDDELEFLKDHVIEPMYARVVALERERASAQTVLAKTERALDDLKRTGMAPRMASTQSSIIGSRLGVTGMPGEEWEAKLESMVSRMAKFERDMTSGVIKFGGLGITNYPEMLAWVEKSIPDNRFGCFVDGVSIFQFLNTSYSTIDLKSYESVERLGLHSQQDARVMTSFQNTLPAVFGNDDETGSLPLPKMTKPTKWSNVVSGTGVKETIRDSFESAKVQVRAQILLLRTPEAKVLAETCLTHSELFIMALSVYYSNVYAELQAGGYESDSAWTLSCKLIRRVFDRIAEVRVSARDGKMRGDESATTALILFATLKAHDVMEEFLQAKFENHPTIASEYVKYLARNSTAAKMGDAMKGVTKLNGQVAAIDTQFKDYKKAIEARLLGLERTKGDGKKG